MTAQSHPNPVRRWPQSCTYQMTVSALEAQNSVHYCICTANIMYNHHNISYIMRTTTPEQ